MAIAIPAYQSYLRKGKAKSAAGDLTALSLFLENSFQKTLAYPTIAQTTDTTTTNSSLTTAGINGWAASQSSAFAYKVVSTASTYTLTADGTGSMTGCTLTLNNTNSRSATSTCGFTTW
ncbi:type IV pilin protein [Andreprevotia chitinilytica]|uniref:type IV pilin protein n=1 Tax=Andreprevotia chitinilytica TaxID=396808 RepID=UPI0006909333|nr:type IV pilin protein [Andreprevotia chitinilytica]